MDKNKNIILLFFLTVLLIWVFESCNRKDQKQIKITHKYLNYPSGVLKEKYIYKNGVLAEVYYLSEDGSMDSTKLFASNKQTTTIKYSYYEDGTIHVDTYEGNLLKDYSEFDSTGYLLYKTPLQIPEVTQTTYKFKSGRNYFEHNKIDTIQIINYDIPPYNRGYHIKGANLTPVKGRINRFAVRRFYQKLTTPDSLIIYIDAAQSISDEKAKRKYVDSLKISVK